MDKQDPYKKLGTRIFITGAAGFIGSHLTRRLLKEGKIIGIQMRENSDLSRISDLFPALKIYSFDIRDTQKVITSIEDFQPDIIIHLAAYYALEQELNIGELITTNVTGTLNIFEAARQVNVMGIIHISTEAVYKEQAIPLKETSPLMPRNIYALSKVQTEEICFYYVNRFNIKSLMFRLFTPYGSNDHERKLIPFIIRNLLHNTSPQLTSGKQQWDFIYIDDVIEAFLLGIRRIPQLKGCEIYNIGSGNPISIRNVGEIIHGIIHSESQLLWGSIPHRHDEIWYNAANIDKARDYLGWEPRISIYEGLTKTVEWYSSL